jgi:outer membrane receptor for ferrienterochelin and colicin
MKNILLLVLLCIVGLAAHAQTTDSVKIITIAHGHEVRQMKINQPLCFLDGKKFSADSLSLIDPNSIESVEVVKGLSAKEKYGDAGKNGVLIITRKEEARKED